MSLADAGAQPTPAEQVRLACEDSQARLRDTLARTSFRRATGEVETWRGYLNTANLGDEDRGPCAPVITAVDVTIPDEFPFVCPAVTPVDEPQIGTIGARPAGNYHQAARGWHRDLNGGMCLFVEADATRIPWADGTALLDQATAWLAQDAAGWPGSEAELDLNRYVRRSAEEGLILYGELEDSVGRHLRLRQEHNGVLRLDGRPALRSKKSRNSRMRWHSNAVLILDIGEPAQPVRTWNDLLDALGESQASQLTRSQADGLRHVAVRYRRREASGVLVLELLGTGTDIQLRYLTAAPDDAVTRAIRSHPQAAELAEKHVAVVGVGAIGSVVADLLHRHGVGQLDLLDPDVFLPGNATRHLLGDSLIGMNKATGTAELLRRTRPKSQTRVRAFNSRVATLASAIEVLAGCDVVVDATADSTGTALLTMAARSGAGQLLSVCVLADGYAVRVDRVPTRSGDSPLALIPLPAQETGAFETGCASPVSATPPAAVWEAAAMASRAVTDLLLAPESVEPGEVHILHPSGDSG